MYYVGIDVGGTNLKAGVVDEQGKIISKVDCPTQVERGHEAVVENMAHLALKAIEKAGVSMDEVKSIGIGIPGVLDPRTGRVPFCTNLGWHDVPVIQLMQKVIDKPIYVDNDATVATLNVEALVEAGVIDQTVADKIKAYAAARHADISVVYDGRNSMTPAWRQEAFAARRNADSSFGNTASDLAAGIITREQADAVNGFSAISQKAKYQN